VYGLERLRSRVYALPQHTPSIRIELADPPEWVTREGWAQQILAGLTVDTDHGDAPTPARQVYDQMTQRGWVSDVRCVTQDVDGTVRIICEEADYRRPIAMMMLQGKYVAVDRSGVRLSTVYDRVEVNSGWMRIFGAEAAAMPAVGEPFEGEDAQAAVEIAGMLFNQSFGRRISAIDVRNFRGRRDSRDVHIFLLAWLHNELRRLEWGSAIGEEYDENTAAEKIRNLAGFFQKGGGSPQARSYDFSIHPTGWIERFADEVRMADGAGSRAR
jgi:hypothetical protein